MELKKKLPLFIVTGASGAGKSTVCQELMNRETDYIVMESDLLWDDKYNTPEDDYRAYRELWMNLCANISQIGKPVVLCGSATPKQFEQCEARKLFSEVFSIAVVCEKKELERRMREGRGITDVNWIESSLEFNQWFFDHAENEKICLLDTTKLSVEQAAEMADWWIRSHSNLKEELET